MEAERFVIPDGINELSRLEAARFYVEKLGWAIHPLYGPKQGRANERGKKPLSEEWKRHRCRDATPEFLLRHFGGRRSHNLGCVIGGDFVHVDLDSKKDEGASVDQWLAGMPSLASVPRELTGGGAHLAFRCRDLPVSVQLSGNALVHKISQSVTAELYFPGTTLVVSPSVHASGFRYRWEVTGEIPLVTWSDLVAWFGFREGGDGSGDSIEAKRGKADRSWISEWKEDLRSFNLVAAVDEAGLLGKCLDPDTNKWAIACPWRELHSGDEPFSPDSGTVIFNPPERLPAFRCLHAHCAERTFKDLIGWLERRLPGLVGAHCSRLRQWESGQQHSDGRPRILLPGMGRPDSEFAAEIGACIGPRRQWFRKGTLVCTVGLREISEKVTALVFSPVQPVEAITAAERFAEVGVLRKNEKGEAEFVPVSMKRECAGMLMAAPQFREQLPAIVRILDVRLPIRFGNEIVFPESGYDPRFRSYCPPDSPEPELMGLVDAKGVLHELHAEFCWKDLQSLTHAIARLITPYCRGLMGWDARFPLWHYAANRPRAGKDYLAVIPGYLYQGWLSEDAPLDRDTEETRKRITAALMSGRRNLHFANCQGFIQDPHFIGAITSKTFSARNLGSTDARADLVLPNEIEFSLSANVGLTFREDIEPRTRRIALEFFDENPNSRRFAMTDLHGWVLTHRPRILGAVAALVQHWIAQGCPSGPTPFNSFPEWARIVGGIMVSCGLGDPCLPHDHQDEIGGDRQETALRSIFRIGYENHPDEWIEKARLFELIEAAAEDEALAFFCREGDLGSRSSKVRIGQALRQFRGRQLGGIQLQIEPNSKSQRQRVKFAQPAAPERVDLCHLLGQVGQVGQVGHINALQKLMDRSEGRALPTEPGGAGGITGEKGAQPDQPDHDFRKPREVRHLTSRADLGRVVDDLVQSGTGCIALDLETYGAAKGGGLDPWGGDIRLLTLCREDGPVWMLDLRAIGYDLGPLAALLQAAVLVIHNAKFDLLWLRVKCGLDCRKVICTLTATRLLTAGTRAGNTLDDCLKRHLGLEPGPDHSRSNWGTPLLTPDQFAYASRDTAHLHELAAVLEDELERAGLGAVWQLEKALLPCVVDMEERGITVDRKTLQAIVASQRAVAAESAKALKTELGDPQLNLSRPTQLLAALRSAGLDLKSTREEELKQADEGGLIPLILQYRAAEKRAQQAEALIEHVKSDNRIHARFEPTGTMTGRFSSKEPNLQNI
jgi:hypothetical protein